MGKISTQSADINLNLKSMYLGARSSIAGSNETGSDLPVFEVVMQISRFASIWDVWTQGTSVGGRGGIPAIHSGEIFPRVFMLMGRSASLLVRIYQGGGIFSLLVGKYILTLEYLVISTWARSSV